MTMTAPVNAALLSRARASLNTQARAAMYGCSMPYPYDLVSDLFREVQRLNDVVSDQVTELATVNDVLDVVAEIADNYRLIEDTQILEVLRPVTDAAEATA